MTVITNRNDFVDYLRGIAEVRWWSDRKSRGSSVESSRGVLAVQKPISRGFTPGLANSENGSTKSSFFSAATINYSFPYICEHPVIDFQYIPIYIYIQIYIYIFILEKVLDSPLSWIFSASNLFVHFYLYFIWNVFQPITKLFESSGDKKATHKICDLKNWSLIIYWIIVVVWSCSFIRIFLKMISPKFFFLLFILVVQLLSDHTYQSPPIIWSNNEDNCVWNHLSKCNELIQFFLCKHASLLQSVFSATIFFFSIYNHISNVFNQIYMLYYDIQMSHFWLDIHCFYIHQFSSFICIWSSNRIKTLLNK